MNKKIIFLIIVAIIVGLFVVKLNVVDFSNRNNNITEKQDIQIPQYSKAEIEARSNKFEISKEEADKLLKSVYDVIEDDNKYEFEDAGDYFESFPIFYVYLSNGDIMNVLAADNYVIDDEKNNFIQVAYNENWEEAIIYKSSIEIENAIITIYDDYFAVADDENEENSLDKYLNNKNYLKNLSIEYSDLSEITNYKEFKYDFEGNGTTDTISVIYENDEYAFDLNGDVMDLNTITPKEVYISNLNPNDKTLEFIIYDEGFSDDPNYIICVVDKGTLVCKCLIPGNEFYADGKGTFYVKNSIYSYITPNVINKKYYIENNILSEENEKVDPKRRYSPIKSDTVFFVEDLEDLENAAILNENEIFEDALKRNNVEILTNTSTFNIIEFSNDTEIKVKLNDGRTGYIVCMDHFAG